MYLSLPVLFWHGLHEQASPSPRDLSLLKSDKGFHVLHLVHRFNPFARRFRYFSTVIPQNCAAIFSAPSLVCAIPKFDRFYRVVQLKSHQPILFRDYVSLLRNRSQYFRLWRLCLSKALNPEKP
jgi:hypothetical protein